MKKTLYFLPGTMCDQRLWTKTWQALEHIAPDAFHFVHLEIPHAQSIDGIIKVLNDNIIDNNSCLVGFSLGGYLATAFTLAYPEKVSRLMIVSNMPRQLPAVEIKERDRTVKWIDKHGYAGIPLKRIQGLVHEKAKNNQHIIDTIQEMDNAFGASTLSYQLHVTTKRKNLLPALGKLSSPIHFCIGQQDHLVDLDYLSQGTSNFMNLSLTSHNGVGHMFPLEAPEILAEEIHQFFSL